MAPNPVLRQETPEVRDLSGSSRVIPTNPASSSITCHTTLVQIDRYLRATAMPESTFGRRAVNDPRLVHDLRNGRRPGPAMVARVERFLAGRAS